MSIGCVELAFHCFSIVFLMPCVLPIHSIILHESLFDLVPSPLLVTSSKKVRTAAQQIRGKVGGFR
jgi:hypothetical protein